MQYGGFLIQYRLASDAANKSRFEGPYSTIEETTKHFEDLTLLEPVVVDKRICRLMINPSNPAWI